mgnify:FL=1
MSDNDELCTTCKHKKRDHYSNLSGCLVTTCLCEKFTLHTWAQRIDEMPRAPIINDDCDRPDQWSRIKLVRFAIASSVTIVRVRGLLYRALVFIPRDNIGTSLRNAIFTDLDREE